MAYQTPIHGALSNKWQRMIDILARISGFAAALVMRSDISEIEVLVSSKSEGNPYHPGDRAKLDTGLYCETVMSERLPLYVGNALDDPDWKDNPDIELGMVCYFGIPLSWPDGSSFGTICVLDSQERRLVPECEEFMLLMREVIEADLQRLVRSAEEARQSDAILHEAEGRYAGIFHQAALGIACVGLDGRWLEVNDRLCEIVGYSSEEMNTLTFQAITHQDDLEPDLNLLQQLLNNKITTYSLEKRYLHKQGHDVWVMLTVSLVRYCDGSPHYFVSIIEDITDKKFLQREFEQAQKLEAMGRLVGGMAHEFNNKLSAITGNLCLALQRPNSYQDCVRDAEKLCFQASEMIGSLLAYARKSPSEKHVVTLVPFLKAVFKSFQVVVPDNIDLVVELGDEQMQLRGNATQIQQIVVNLINNAIYAVHSAKRPEVRVELEKFEASPEFKRRHPSLTSKRLAKIVVEDNGIGMSKHELERIFDPFYTTKPIGKGTGLGLAMVASLVEQHGGIIEVDSDPGRGARFEVFLPLLEQKQSQAEKVDKEPIVSGDGRTILVVDDNENVLMITSEVLQMLGYDVLMAREGKQALEIYLANEQISCVLTDVVMPVMGGVELFNRLKAIDAAVKVVFMTGHDARDVVSTLNAAVLLKPVNFAELNVALQRTLNS